MKKSILFLGTSKNRRVSLPFVLIYCAISALIAYIATGGNYKLAIVAFFGTFILLTA
jgi:uncharacterized membrane protein